MATDPQTETVDGSVSLSVLETIVDQLEQNIGALLTITPGDANTILTLDGNSRPNRFITLRIVSGAPPALAGLDLVCQGDARVGGNAVHLAAYRPASTQPSVLGKSPILSSSIMAEFRQSGLPLEAQAFLGDISTAEATRFDELAGGSTFSSFATFPNWPGIPSIIPGKRSHGAGLFQFEPGTWAGVVSFEQPTLPDFSPRSQIIGAWRLARRTYGSTLFADLQAGNLSDTRKIVLRTQWARGLAAGPPGQVYDQLLKQLP